MRRELIRDSNSFHLIVDIKMKYLLRLICNDRITTHLPRHTSRLLSRIIPLDIDSIEEELSQFYYINGETRIALRDMPQYEAINKMIKMQWTLITRDDLKILRDINFNGGGIRRDYFNDSSECQVSSISQLSLRYQYNIYFDKGRRNRINSLQI